jgi:phospholipase C
MTVYRIRWPTRRTARFSTEEPQNIVYGEQFAASVIDAVMSGPGWQDTLRIWTFDEHGGYYDHVPPPAAIVSPWARPDYVSHQVFDHTSICALVEAKWNLPALTYRDANANNMLDMVDFSAPAFLHPPALAKPPLATDQGRLPATSTGRARSRRPIRSASARLAWTRLASTATGLSSC